jgi:hypothetical protein
VIFFFSVIFDIIIFKINFILRKPDVLSRDDLKIDWKPIYQIFLRVQSINERSSELAPS